MDFNSNRHNNSNRPAGVFRPHAEAQEDKASAPVKAHGTEPTDSNANWSKWKVWTGGLLTVAVALLLAGAFWLFIFAKPASQANYVDGSNLQAVFLTNKQVYFGKVYSVNDNFLVLRDIYYLQSPQNASNKSTSGNVSLVKLGCELHRPQDQMIINQRQVSFWENLQKDGQVAKAVANYQQAHPNGQQCPTNTQTTQPNQTEQTPPANQNQDQTNTSPNTSGTSDNSKQSDTNTKQ